MRTVTLFFTLLACSMTSASQNVFNPLDTQSRHDRTAPLGSRNNPNPARTGLQKWVSTPTNGISTSYDASSYKAYFINVGGRRMAFRLKFPFSYLNPDSSGKRYPLMLFFHGAGEAGCQTNGGIYNNEKQLLHGGKLFMDRVDNNQFEGFLLYPQAVAANCSNYWGTAYDGAINAVLDSLIKYIRVDVDRLFVNGLSDGGRTTWRFARTFPQRVARVAPSAMSAMTTNLTSMIHIPVWFATGGRDTNPTPQQAQETLTAFTNLGGNIKYTLFPTLGHGVWNQHWNEPGYVDYMNETHKANPLVYFNRYEWCPGQPISARLGLTSGFNAYEWQKDGVVIARRINGVNTILVPAQVASFSGNEIVVRNYGTFRARFRRTTTSAWSEWSPKPAVLTTKGITQTAPITVRGVKSKVLPAPDGSTSVTLQLPSGFLNYEWYRVSDNVVVSRVDTFNAAPGTYRARYSERFGCGTNFSPDFFVPGTSSTPKPDAAANLVAVPNSERSNQLTWSSNPSPIVNETGFEIYRSTTSGGPYTLINITPADVSTYLDNGLEPNTVYYYLVRAVAETGAADVSNEAGSKTVKDIIPPTAPTRLEYRGSNQYSVALRWSAASDNVGVRRYEIYVNDVRTFTTTSTSYTVRGLDSIQTYKFTVRAVDAAGNRSAPSAQLLARTHRQGLNYRYINGSFTSLPNFNAVAAVKQGIIDSVNTGSRIRTQADNYAILWEGYIFVPETSTYTFETLSDEGSRLYIDQEYSFDATPLINNDGIHTATSRSAEITLSRGYHRFAVSYFERTGNETMEVYWSNTTGNFSRRRIVDLYFTYEDVSPPAPLIAPTSLNASATGFNKVELTWQDLSDNESGFEIMGSQTSNGTYVNVGTVESNEVEFANTGLASATTYFYKVRAVGPENESQYTDFVSVTTPAAPGTPIAPSDLLADNVATTSIALSWMDNSNNETNIQVWKSTDNINFTLAATLPANSNTYNDKDVVAFTQYYYYVIGVNENGSGERTEVIEVIAGNNAPVAAAAADMFVKTDNSVSQVISITDPGDNIAVRIINKLSFISLESVSPDNYQITVSPTTDDIGWYDCILSVKDSKGAEIIDSFRVTVADKNTRSVYINFGSVQEIAPVPWNNWGGLRSAGNTLSNLRDETNSITPFGITTVNGWAYLTQLGHITGNNSGVLPDSVLRSGIADSISATPRQIRLTGLNTGMRYNLVFVASQNEGINAQSEYAVGTQRDTITATYNTQQTANLNGLAPDASGQILVNIRRLAHMSYLNAMVIEEYSPAITVLNPLNLFVEAADRNAVNLSWSDRTNNENAVNGYELTRASDSSFSNIQATILLPHNTTTYRMSGLSPNTKYWFRVRAVAGGVFSDYSNRGKTITPANRVLVNFNVSVPDAASPWNNLITSPDQFETFNNLLNQNGQVSGLTMRIEQPFNGEFTAGMSTGNNSGVVPDNVLRSNYWINRTQIAQLRITGLNQTKRYRFGFIGSSSPNGWYKDNYTGTYSINGRTVYLNSWQNSTKIVYIGNVVPDEDGAALLSFSSTQAAAYAFHAGLIIEDYTDVNGGSVNNSVLEEAPADMLSQSVAEGHIYPNPFTNRINVVVNGTAPNNRIIAELYDVTGRLVYKAGFGNVGPGLSTLAINPTSAAMPDGFYLVVLKMNGKVAQNTRLLKVSK
jgi:chitodextrinase/dienelactone hydrolase